MSDISIVTQAARTGTTGTQDFTVPGSTTPKGALFFATFCTADGTPVNHSMIALGMTDGTTHRSFYARLEDASNPADSSNAESDSGTNYPILIGNQTTTTIDGTATFDSWINSGGNVGIRLNWTDVPASAYLVTCVLFHGAGIDNCYVTRITGHATVNNSITVTPNFATDIVLFMTHNSSWNDSVSTPAEINFGMCVNDGSNTQRSVDWRHTNTTIPSSLTASFDTTSVYRSSVGGASGVELQVQDFTATNFKVFTRVQSTAVQGIIMAIKLNGLNAKLVTSEGPTANGNHTIASIGWKPQFALMLHSSIAAVDTAVQDDSSEVWGLSAIATNGSACVGIFGEDDSTPVDAENIHSSNPIMLRKDGANYIVATTPVFTSDGLQLNYTTQPGSATQRAVLFIEEGDIALTSESGSYSTAGHDALFRLGSPLYLRYRK